MSDTTLPDLSRTAEALAVFDAAYERWDNIGESIVHGGLDRADSRLWDEEKALGAWVGECFGLDTADRNSVKTCVECVRPGAPVPPPGCELSFVRRAVAEWKDQCGRTAQQKCDETSA